MYHRSGIFFAHSIGHTGGDMPRSNSEIKSDILNNLIRDSRLQHSKIKVEVDSGMVVLTGSVQSFQAREATESNIWAVSGVTAIDNRLNIIFPREFKKPSDDAIRENVQRILVCDPDVFLERIVPFVQDGTVILEGSVDALWKKFRVQQLVQNAGGVLAIINKLTVTPFINMSDERIGKDITGLLNRNTALNVNAITVEVQNGNVRLAGTVANRSAFDIAEDIARYTQGVIHVDNKLVIRGED
jgi:osmotically-inducible protein OsmY